MIFNEFVLCFELVKNIFSKISSKNWGEKLYQLLFISGKFNSLKYNKTTTVNSLFFIMLIMEFKTPGNINV